MIVYVVGHVANILNYAYRSTRHRNLRRRERDTELRLDLDREFWAGRPLRPAIRAEARKWSEYSNIPEVEIARRAQRTSFYLGVGWLFAGLPIALVVEGAIRQTAAVSPGIAGIQVISLATAFVWAYVLAGAAVAQTADRRKVVGAVGGIVASATVIVVTYLAFH